MKSGLKVHAGFAIGLPRSPTLQRHKRPIKGFLGSRRLGTMFNCLSNEKPNHLIIGGVFPGRKIGHNWSQFILETNSLPVQSARKAGGSGPLQSSYATDRPHS